VGDGNIGDANIDFLNNNKLNIRLENSIDKILLDETQYGYKIIELSGDPKTNVTSSQPLMEE
jgi:hypothetical protein